MADRARVDVAVDSVGSYCGVGGGRGGGGGCKSGGVGCTDDPVVGFHFVFTGCVACL